MSTTNTAAGQATTDTGSTTPSAATGTPNAGAGATGATAAAATTAAAGATTTTEAAAPAAAAAATGAAQTTGTQEAAAETPAGAPEKYELSIPEGGVLDQSDVDAFIEKARAKGMTNEQAQAALTEIDSTYRADAARFLAETQAHAEIGGDKLAAAQQNARLALERFLPAESPEGKTLRSFMDKTGVGNHPALLLMLSRIGKAMAEDTPIGGAASRGAERTIESLFYGGGQA